jgi:hypothetical protein
LPSCATRKREQRRRPAALRLPVLFGGDEGWGLGCGEDCGGFFGNARAFKEVRVLPASEPDRIGEGEVAEIVCGDAAALDELVGFGQSSMSSTLPVK